MFHQLEILLRKHGLLLNKSKTKIVIFGRKYCSANDPKFILNGSCVEIVAEFNYLGCILDCNLLGKSGLRKNFE